MKKGTLLLVSLFFSGYVNAAPVCGCSYPLDATSSQYTTVGMTPFPSISGQTISHNVLDTNGGGVVEYRAGSNSAVTAVLAGQDGDVTLPTSGVVAFEMAIEDHLSAVPSNSMDEGLMLMIENGSGFMATLAFQSTQPPLYQGPRIQAVMRDNGTYLGNAVSYNISVPLDPTFRFGIYFNMDTREMGYTIDGVDQGYLSGTIPTTVSDVYVTIGATTNASAGENVLGERISASLITNAAYMNQPYPSGTVDICGNTI